MILSEIKHFKNKTATDYQRIIIKCDECGKEWDSALLNQKNGYEKYNKDLCIGCKRKLDYKEGRRNSNLIVERNKLNKGKTLEEILGKEKAIAANQKNSISNSGKNNANFGGKYSHGFGHGKLKIYGTKGLKIEDIYGIDKALKMRKNYSINRSGEKNNMYGKPSPQGSGNGWSGWYKGWFFRSLKELSYMIYVIERFNLKWESAEKKKFKIDYIDYTGNKRTYHPDFLIENKYLVEIKPKCLWNSDNVKRKAEAAIEFCSKYNFKYKLTESPKLIKFTDIKQLVINKKVIFTDRYQEKFNNLKI
jgi:hypothetical protein